MTLSTEHVHVVFSDGHFISSADDVSSAELMVLLIVRRPSVNFCFKSLLLLQFLFDNSEFFTGETRHIVPPCNKAGISNFCLEFLKLQKFQWKRHFSSVLIRSFWNFTGETRYIVWPYNKARISNWFWGQLDCSILANLLKQKVLKYVIMHSLWQLS